MKTSATTSTAAVLAALAIPAIAEEHIPKPPPEPIRIEITEAPLEYDVIHAETSYWMAALPEFAVLTQPRSLSILRAGGDAPEPAGTLLQIPGEIDYFGIARAVEGRILVSVGSYDEEQRRREAATPRGGFIAGPKPAGILVITANPPAVEWIKSCRVIHWPEPDEQDKGIAGPAPDTIIPALQDARIIDGKLHIADYGRSGILDLNDHTWHGLDVDWGMQLSRIGPIKHPGGRMFLGYDEGGMAGGVLNWFDGAKRGHLSTDPGMAPNEMLGFGDRIFVTTDYGLAEIADPGGDAVLRHFVDPGGKSPIFDAFGLAKHRDMLWVASVKHLLRFDPAKNTATLHQLPEGTEFYRLCSFDGHIHALGPDNLARIKLPEH